MSAEDIKARFAKRNKAADSKVTAKQPQAEETMVQVYEDEGKRRAAEQREKDEKMQEEKTALLTTSIQIKGETIREFKELQLELRLNGGYQLTYEKVLICGLKRLKEMSSLEQNVFMEQFKKSKV